MDHGDRTRVLLAIATRGRPRLLAACLDSIARVRVPDGVSFQVLVVDNNPGGDAESIAARDFPVPLRYAHLPRPGIASARNRAIEEALAGGADALGFVDDDTVVSPGWLGAVHAALGEEGYDVVKGPVHFALPPDCPAWITTAFPPPEYPAGPVPDEDLRGIVHTNSVAFRIHLVAAWGLRFPPSYDLSGAEDTFFFCRARDRGAATTWAPEAAVTEELPPSRASLGWFLRRRLRIGNTRVFLDDDLGYRKWSWLVTLHFIGHVLEKGLLNPFLATLRLDLGEARRVDLLGDLAWSIGGLLACLGYRYLEYREVHGA